MINYNSLKKVGRNLALVGSVGLAGLLGGCDTPGDLTLYETTIQGPVKVKLIQEVNTFPSQKIPDNYRIEIYDASGQERVNFKSSSLWAGTKVVSDDGTAYVVKNGKRYLEKIEEKNK